MSIPKFLNCVMTPEVIQAIRSRQADYDKDPVEYERRERVEKERREEEEYHRQTEESEIEKIYRQGD